MKRPNQYTRPLEDERDTYHPADLSGQYAKDLNKYIDYLESTIKAEKLGKKNQSEQKTHLTTEYLLKLAEEEFPDEKSKGGIPQEFINELITGQRLAYMRGIIKGAMPDSEYFQPKESDDEAVMDVVSRVNMHWGEATYPEGLYQEIKENYVITRKKQWESNNDKNK